MTLLEARYLHSLAKFMAIKYFWIVFYFPDSSLVWKSHPRDSSEFLLKPKPLMKKHVSENKAVFRQSAYE